MNLLRKLNLLAISVFALTMIVTSQAAVIKKGDTLQLSLKGVPASEQVKVNGDYRVRDTGNIRIPIINVNIETAGRSPEQVERSIEAAFRAAEIYTTPTVSLQIIKNGVLEGKVISIGGQVRKPGRVQYREGMTLV